MYIYIYKFCTDLYTNNFHEEMENKFPKRSHSREKRLNADPKSYFYFHSKNRGRMP